MKLRNKKTGKIEEITYIIIGCENEETWFDSIADLAEKWEDYEDESQYTISDDGEVVSYAVDYINEDTDKGRKIIGNSFRTKEEAEKAVENLKAWKRLKDKGFEFSTCGRYENFCGNGFEIPITATMPPEAYTDVEVSKDLDLLFGGDE